MYRNVKRVVRAGALVGAVLSLSGCQWITVPEHYPWTFNAEHGDRVDIIMDPVDTPEGTILERCDHMGGELIYNPATLIWTCEGVDF